MSERNEIETCIHAENGMCRNEESQFHEEYISSDDCEMCAMYIPWQADSAGVGGHEKEEYRRN